MKLINVITDRSSLDESYTIYATTPWTKNSECVVEYEPDDGALPDAAKINGMKYFIEVFLLNEFVEGWLANSNVKPSDEEICQRVIYYAQNDA
ncbi:hypothetical protein CWI80_08755 [Pseudidiomarina sediminum]|uniref:DUF7716 domain-containing protein n=1 Tax=Pseudidiomarina sediminum TaxID=431675 RepID=A0A432Z408_9GAMM|nr:hypothetical protein [Pseudidiomarina sediminum]RUO72626.1 hypothetical protein CWI80_08755 [Pseudidiomarina sediminum]